MIYNLDSRMPVNHIIIYGFQELLAVLVATTLIASICGVPIGAGLIGAGLSTLVYIWATRGKSNVYVSNSGCFVAPVLFALGTGNGLAAFIGGLVICVVYCLLGFGFSKFSIDTMYKFLPKPLIASITMLIGLNLIGFIPTYLGDSGYQGIIVAFVTMVTIALTMHYAKGRLKTLPFLVGVVAGYIVALAFGLVDFSAFANAKLFSIPAFNFTNFHAIDSATLITVVVMYLAYAMSGACEVIADHQAMSSVIGEDLFKKVGIKRVFFGMGIANAISGCVSGLGQTSYGEGTGCTSASRVANARVTFATSIMLILMGVCGYIQALLISIPSCVFAGASIILYPLIAIAGVRMLVSNHIDLDNSKNMLLVGVPLAIGLSGIAIGNFSGTALALIVGIIINIVLKENHHAF